MWLRLHSAVLSHSDCLPSHYCIVYELVFWTDKDDDLLWFTYKGISDLILMMTKNDNDHDEMNIETHSWYVLTYIVWVHHSLTTYCQPTNCTKQRLYLKTDTILSDSDLTQLLDSKHVSVNTPSAMKCDSILMQKNNRKHERRKQWFVIYKWQFIWYF